MKQTLENLTKAFVGESQARNRYTYYAKAAQKEGYEQIAGIFMETADQEKTHAKRLFEHIQELKKHDEEARDDEIMLEGVVTPITYGTTIENLKAAIAGEKHEYSSMYPEFAAVAEREGLGKIAARLQSIAKAEEHHEERYKKLLQQLEKETLFRKSKKIWWVCRECGYMYYGEEPPKECPSCDHPQGFYQVKCEEY